MSRSLKIVIPVSLVLTASLFAPAFASENLIPAPVISYMLDGKPLKRETARKAVLLFDSEVDAALVILLSGDLGYTWEQVVDAIHRGTLRNDGSISGLTPEPAPAVRIRPETNVSPKKYTDEEVREIHRKLKAIGSTALSVIQDAVCHGYTAGQITVALQSNRLTKGGLILCRDEHRSRGWCLQIESTVHEGDFEFIEVPKDILNAIGYDSGTPLIYVNVFEPAWENCGKSVVRSSPPDPIPRGCWKDPPYHAKVEYASNGYEYTGRQPTMFGPGIKHSGNIRLTEKNLWEGDLQDEDGYCCGNHGHLWLRMKDRNTCSIRSEWFAFDGTPIKKTGWQDLEKDWCENFPE